MDTAFGNFIRTREVNFYWIPCKSSELERRLGVVEKDVKEGRNMSPTLSSVKEVNTYLDDL